MDTQNPETRPSHRRRHHALLVGLAVLLVAAAGLAVAGGPGRVAARLGGHFMHGEHAREFVEFRIHRELRDVGATQAQEDQILAIVDDLFAQHAAHDAMRKEMHDKVAAALTGDTVDRAALEAARVQILQHADEGSKVLVKAIGDMAEVLTPAQRQALAAKHKERFE